MAVITYTALAARFVAGNPATIATALGGGVTAANVLGLVELLTILANSKDLGTPPLLRSKLAQAEFNPQ